MSTTDPTAAPARQDKNDPQAPVTPLAGQNPDATAPLSDDERKELDTLKNRHENTALQPNELEHLRYLQRRDAQQNAADDLTKPDNPYLTAVPATHEDLVKDLTADPVALNRAQSSAYQGLLARGQVTQQDVIDHKAFMANEQAKSDQQAQQDAANRSVTDPGSAPVENQSASRPFTDPTAPPAPTTSLNPGPAASATGVSGMSQHDAANA